MYDALFIMRIGGADGGGGGGGVIVDKFMSIIVT